jgi:hypothetical protein
MLVVALCIPGGLLLLIVVAQLVLFFIRGLNQTWLDPEWRAARLQGYLWYSEEMEDGAGQENSCGAHYSSDRSFRIKGDSFYSRPE